ncbi:MAG: glucosaminidase domain-containing protein [Dysgonamonadaceae bacterium]|nr:glucosaminidase domain-containing protein [Dysgonamonadaceae bacterium]
MRSLIFTVCCFLLLFPAALQAQGRKPEYTEYIRIYNGLAVKHMKQYKIPASITLAQGLLESRAGKSDLVRDANNHFGIKCHSDWTGRRVYRADDGPNDCFRGYKKAEDSYEDHARFLLRTRYARLFDLGIRDYKAWAKGLQQCGYATDKAYANKLIKLIEDYELYRYDARGKSNDPEFIPLRRSIYIDHGLLYVLAEANDSYARIAEDTGFKVKHLAKWNEAPEDFPLCMGDIVWLEKKHKKAEKPYFEHIVRVGESMHSISQLYGVQVKQLYKRNKKGFDYLPEEGDALRLR